MELSTWLLTTCLFKTEVAMLCVCVSPVAIGHDQDCLAVHWAPRHPWSSASPGVPCASSHEPPLLHHHHSSPTWGDKTRERLSQETKERRFLFFLPQIPTFNLSSVSSLPPFSFSVGNFKVSDSLNWTVIITVTKPGGFVLSFFSPSLLSSWPVSCATTNTSYRGCSFHELIKTQSGDTAWLRIRERHRNCSWPTVSPGLPSAGAHQTGVNRCDFCHAKQPLALKVYVSTRNLIPR